MPQIALTFDNLGEAADLERGLWPDEAPLGDHASVTEALPRLLDELDALGLRATFCVEAMNCELYPEAVRSIADRGHELGVHGWSHEAWDTLGADREEWLLRDGRSAFAALGVDARGFRPPGGALTGRSLELLGAHGYAWCSPLGERRARVRAVACVPFAWGLVDAYHRLGSFADRRAALGDPRDGRSADEAASEILARLRAGAPPTVILHPYLMVDEDGFAAARRVLRGVRELGSVATVGDIAVTL